MLKLWGFFSPELFSNIVIPEIPMVVVRSTRCLNRIYSTCSLHQLSIMTLMYNILYTTFLHNIKNIEHSTQI